MIIAPFIVFIFIVGLIVIASMSAKASAFLLFLLLFALWGFGDRKA